MNDIEGILSQVRQHLLDTQQRVFRIGGCEEKPCTRYTNKNDWRDYGQITCTDKTHCLPAGLLENIIGVELSGKRLFYKAISWEYNSDIEGFRLLDIVGGPWSIEERKFMYDHYKGQVGILSRTESRLLAITLSEGSHPVWEGFDKDQKVYDEAKSAFDQQTAIALRLDYISGLRGNNAAALLMLFFHKNMLPGEMVLPEKFDPQETHTKGFLRIVQTVACVSTPIIISEIFRRKVEGRPSRLNLRDFHV